MNTAPVIDTDYYNNPNNEGHIFAKMRMEKQGPALKLSAGEAFMQGIILPYYIVEGDNTTAQRMGGMGSTEHRSWHMEKPLLLL